MGKIGHWKNKDAKGTERDRETGSLNPVMVTSLIFSRYKPTTRKERFPR